MIRCHPWDIVTLLRFVHLVTPPFCGCPPPLFWPTCHVSHLSWGGQVIYILIMHVPSRFEFQVLLGGQRCVDWVTDKVDSALGPFVVKIGGGGEGLNWCEGGGYA